MNEDWEEVREEPASSKETMLDSPACTDVANAARFAAQHGAKARYVPAWKRWITWDGARWRRDEDGMVWRFARAVARNILLEARNADSESEEKALARWAVQTHNEKKLRSMVNLASNEAGIPVNAAHLDLDPWLMNVQNGTIDLRTGKIRDHDPGDLLTKVAPVEFNPGAQAPRFRQFLLEIMAGNTEMVSFLQRAIGYSLTGDTRARTVFILYGVGRNGKSTLLEILQQVLGEYASNTPIGTLMAGRDTGNSNDLARLQGARLVYASESDEQQRLNEARLKAITGQDQVTCRFLYGEFFSYTPQFKLFFSTNHKPIVQGTDAAIWDRLKLIPFGTRFLTPEELARGEQGLPIDETLSVTLKREFPGILAWAIEGCLEWQRIGLQAPPEITSATSEYRKEMDALQEFLSARCIVSDALQVRATVLYKAFALWSKEGGEAQMNQRCFGMRMTERAFRRVKSTGGLLVYRGLALRQVDEVDEEERTAGTSIMEEHGKWSTSSASSARQAGDEEELSPSELAAREADEYRRRRAAMSATNGSRREPRDDLEEALIEPLV